MERSPQQPERDPVEDELASLRPCDLSVDLVERIGRALDTAAPLPLRSAGTSGERSLRRSVWRIAGVTAAAAAGLAALALLRPVRPPVAPRGSPDMVVRDLSAGGVDERTLTFAAYHRALARSPEAVDELLSLHPRSAVKSGEAPQTAIRAFGPRRLTVARDGAVADDAAL